MDKALIEYLVNIAVLVPIVLILIVISLKLSRKSIIDKLNMTTYAQVIERSAINKDISLYVIKIGRTGCVVVSSQHNTQVIKELDEAEVEEIIRMKTKKHNNMDLSKISGLNMERVFKNKFIRKKDYGSIK